MRQIWLILAVLSVLAGGGITAWWVRGDEPPPEEPPADDTGMGDETTNQLLQEIGYLKGSSR